MRMLRVWFRAIFYSVGTLLHELAHFVFLKPFGFTDLKFSMIPKMVFVGGQREIVFGSVSANLSSNKSSFWWFIPSIMPIMWWVLLVYLLVHYQILDISWNGNLLTSTYSITLGVLDFSELKTYFLLYAFSQLLWAGHLSRQDVKVMFSSLFSFGGLFLVGFLLIVPFRVYTTKAIDSAIDCYKNDCIGNALGNDITVDKSMNFGR